MFAAIMFNFLAATTARERMDELERFLAFWYGPRRPEYGEPAERLRDRELPYPLRRFYAFAGRWPSPTPRHEVLPDLFYTGSAGHHLLDLDSVTVRPDGRVAFFMEYQGDWDGLTLPNKKDPPVWIEGAWEGDGRDEEDEDASSPRTMQVGGSLSGFLITHCLMTTLYEHENSPASSSAASLGRWFRRGKGKAVRLWDAEPPGCPNYEGSFYLFHDHVLVHEVRSFRQFGALHPEGIALLVKHRKGDD